MNKSKHYIAGFIGLFLMFLGFDAMAVAPDFSAITTVVDFSTVISGIVSIMAALAGVYIISRGGSMILGKIRR